MSQPRAAALYLRISEDRDKTALGVARQEKEARALAKRLGWTIGPHASHVVVENDTSAFTRKRVTLPDGSTALRVYRPGFRHVLDLITTDAADGLLAVDLDRTARDPRDLEDLIDAVEGCTPRLPVESLSGSLRLANDADVTMARVMVAVANKSSRDTSRRLVSKHEELADAGKFAGGVRRFGFASNGVDHNHDEAERIRWCAEQVLAGASVSSVVRLLDEQGVAPVKAKRWSAKTLTDILISPRLAGFRVHRGVVVGEACWAPIVDRETHERLVATVKARGRGYVQPKLVRWCNQLLTCGLCGHLLSGSTVGGNRPPVYWCSTRTGGCGKIVISAPRVESLLEQELQEMLDKVRPTLQSEFVTSSMIPSTNATSRTAEDDEAKLRQLARMYANDEITLAEFTEARKVVAARLRQAREPRTVSPRMTVAARQVLESTETLTAQPADIKRDVARNLLRNAHASGWVVHPADPTRPRRFDPDRVRLVNASA